MIFLDEESGKYKWRKTNVEDMTNKLSTLKSLIKDQILHWNGKKWLRIENMDGEDGMTILGWKEIFII